MRNEIAERERKRIANDKWRKANPVKVKASAARWAAANRGKTRTRNAAWYAAHRSYYEDKKLRAAGRSRAVKCDVCRRTGPTYFDHCHSSKRFRGWLCRRCNLTLGHVGDSAAFADEVGQIP